MPLSSARRLPVLAEARQPPLDMPPIPSEFGAHGVPPLTDRAGRQYRYLRLSITDRCQMACTYCMPEGGEGEHALRRDVLSFEQIARLTGVFSSLGIRRVRFTGGEPLLRKGIADLVGMVRQSAPLDALWLTTNGTFLATHAASLKEAGLSGVNVSLDSLQPERFSRITRGAALSPVLKGIDVALSAGLAVKLNTVALRDVNEDEFEAIVQFAWARGILPRFIELMPLGEGARILSDHHLPVGDVRARLAHLLDDVSRGRDATAGPAQYFQARHQPAHRVGFIGAISDSFCDGCNRIRLTSRGEIISCIASRRAVPLKALMERGHADRELAWAVHWALSSKLAGHEFSLDDPRQHGRGMSLVGG